MYNFNFNKIQKLFIFVVTLLCFVHVFAQNILNEPVNHKEIKCLVCEQIIKEMQLNISKINPNKMMKVGYKLDGGESDEKSVEFRLSESYLTELMEEVCEIMNDYVKAKHKVTGQLIVMPIMSEPGKMNALMAEVDIVQDENLNKNLKLYCEEILEIHDEHIIKHLQTDLNAPVKEICANICQPYERDEL